MGNMKHKMTLRRFFLKNFIYFIFGIVSSVLFGLLIFNILVSERMLYPANYAQEQLEKIRVKLETDKKLDISIIPNFCQYIIFDLNGTIKSGNMNNKKHKEAWEAVQGDLTDDFGNHYTVFTRESEYCVVQYQLESQYKSALLRKYLPPPEKLLIRIIGFTLVHRCINF